MHACLWAETTSPVAAADTARTRDTDSRCARPRQLVGQSKAGFSEGDWLAVLGQGGMRQTSAAAWRWLRCEKTLHHTLNAYRTLLPYTAQYTSTATRAQYGARIIMVKLNR